MTFKRNSEARCNTKSDSPAINANKVQEKEKLSHEMKKNIKLKIKYKGKLISEINFKKEEIVKESSEQVKEFEKSKMLKCSISNEPVKENFGLNFYKGEKVEVRSDEEGFEGSWFTATIVDYLKNGKYLVEYLTLKTDDLCEQLKGEANVSDVRPYPPEINQVCQFKLHERVDVWYNDGWWEGRVSSVVHGSNGNLKYNVYFWTTNEELEFEHDNMRPHQEWVRGQWMLSSMD
ncbi:protein AGENET DOMAIN (AGD)-CONTAINING P1-like [Vicia villosa]|uniref:protein AGENET DOMAIN (AGD)-CONTAINING P1-like n=1 Tax=Vicia villosa TaxID=3911 RepID=UPI00273AC9A4|nr:protein AGENET DOMAIN (AGD)-CONTAINING P1-like [Vicia villosa]